MNNLYYDEKYEGVPFPSYEALELSRSKSSKSVNPKIYDRYEKYHHPVGTVFISSTVIDYVISIIKKVIS